MLAGYGILELALTIVTYIIIMHESFKCFFSRNAPEQRRNEPERALTRRNVPERAGTRRNAPERAGMRRNAPERAETHRNAPKRAIFCQRAGTRRSDVPVRTGTRRNAPVCAFFSRAISLCNHIFLNWNALERRSDSYSSRKTTTYGYQ